MSVDPWTLAAILAMAAITYATRIGGFVALRRIPLGPRARTVLDTVPGCVLVAVIAPAVLTQGPADLAAGLVTAALALALPLLPTVLGGIAAAAVLRALLG